MRPQPADAAGDDGDVAIESKWVARVWNGGQRQATALSLTGKAASVLQIDVERGDYLIGTRNAAGSGRCNRDLNAPYVTFTS